MRNRIGAGVDPDPQRAARQSADRPPSATTDRTVTTIYGCGILDTILDT